MNRETAAELRAPFPAEKVGKLPRVTCGKCRDSREKVCDQHAKSKCPDCHNYITTQHIHLDFIGHADATDRFLSVDPDWTWEPFALDARGLPALDEHGGMWIRLTIAGTTKIGYGDADGKKGASAVKETIGDALRNAGMRFGVALDLWRKETPADEPPAQRRRRREPEPPPSPKPEPPAEPRTEWDPIEQEALFDGWSAEIAKAASDEEIATIGKRLLVAKRGGDSISPTTYAKLATLGGQRKAELNGAPS